MKSLQSPGAGVQGVRNVERKRFSINMKMYHIKAYSKTGKKYITKISKNLAAMASALASVEHFATTTTATIPTADQNLKQVFSESHPRCLRELQPLLPKVRHKPSGRPVRLCGGEVRLESRHKWEGVGRAAGPAPSAGRPEQQEILRSPSFIWRPARG